MTMVLVRATKTIMPPLTNILLTELIPSAQTSFAFKLYQVLSDPENQYVSKLLI